MFSVCLVSVVQIFPDVEYFISNLPNNVCWKKNRNLFRLKKEDTCIVLLKVLNGIGYDNEIGKLLHEINEMLCLFNSYKHYLHVFKFV